MPAEYDVYVSSSMPFNAGVIGSQKPIIVFGASMLRELSMGMSGDFEVAVQEGATIVRVGTAIFGSRHVEH